MPRSLPVLASRSAVHEPLSAMPGGFGDGGLPPLTDAQGRRYTYLRLSVTDRCDLACVYCMPPSGEDEHALRLELLSFEEIVRLVGVAAELGVVRVRLTGGEPLVRRDVVSLVERIRRGTPVEEVVMTSNATRLAELAQPLARAGLTGVNVSIDSLDARRFARLTRGGALESVVAGIHAAIAAGLEVKLNAVLLRGENDDEAEALVRFAWELGITMRFIELMPLGEGEKLGPDARVTSAEVRERLAHLLGEPCGLESHRGPARYLAARDGSGRRVGFITPISDEFCGSCNRIRVTARGDLRACLASRRAISLRDLIRGGASDAELAWALHAALGSKAAGHFFNDASVREHAHVGMSLIGG